MLQVWMIVLFGAVYLHDAMAGPDGAARPLAPAAGWVSEAAWRRDAAVAVLGGIALVVVANHLLLRALGRRIDRRGSLRALLWADRVALLSRTAVTGLYLVGVLALGWLDAVRSLIGDWVAVDELVAITPPVLAVIAGWWSYSAIDRRLRESTLVRRFEEGKPVYPHPTAGQYVWSNVRHNLLFSGIPIALIMAWSELFTKGEERLSRLAAVRGWAGSDRLHHFAQWAVGTDAGRGTIGIVQIAGVVAVLLCTPLIVRVAWDTIPLGDGPVRRRLLGLCIAERVRVRDLLVWRTRGTMVNGAVIGFLGRLRYILLTDSLLDSLPGRQVEAVMAHEIAHVRCRHIPWLLASMMAVLMATGALSRVAIGPELEARISGWPVATQMGIQVGVAALTVATIWMAIGFISRRFEWQADAFAAAHLSEKTLPVMEAGVQPVPESQAAVTPEAVAAMAGALESVAILNHVPRQKFSWRHGSIAERQNRLSALVGTRVDRLPIDRTVRRVKRLVALVLVTSAGVGVWLEWPRGGEGGGEPAQARSGE